MALFVMLNFEDPDPSYQGGRVKAHASTKTSNLPANVVGSAQSTIKGIIAKASAKSTFFKGNQVHHYSCLEVLQADLAGTLTADDVKHIRADCAKAKKIYIVMHGKPDDTEQGFSNLIKGVQVAVTWKQLSRLALLLFPAGDHLYHIGLIMCYGARTDQYRVNNLGVLPLGVIKTSFAYKFFRSVCVARNVTMTAVTGAVSTTEGGANEVETEEWVSATLDMIDYKKDTQTRADLDQRKLQARANFQGTDQAWSDLCQPFATNKDAPAGADPLKQFLKTYYYEKVHRNTELKARKDQAAQLHGGVSNRSKYGRVLYSYTGPGLLRVINKYGDPGNPAIGQDYVMYSGPLL